MKAKFLALAALVLGLASCQTEPESLGVNVGGEQDVTVCVSLPEVTRANSAEGAFVNVVNSSEYTIRYILQVFYGETAAPQDVKYSDGTSVNFDVRLVPGRDYKFVVWADVVKEAERTDLHYNTTDLTAITFKGDWNAMDETRDAFTVVEPIENYNGSKSINLTLTRPFAKLRVQTTDLGELANLGLAPYKTVVTYTTAHYRSFNALNGVPTDKTYASKTHELINLESYGYEANTLFVDYFYATESPETVKFEMKVYDKDEVEPLKTNNFSTDIPVQRNYLTTISGNILTDGNNVKVNIVNNGAFEGTENWPDTTAEQLAYAAMFGGEVTLAENVELTQPLTIVNGANVVINLNGKTLKNNVNNEATDVIIVEQGGKLTINGEGTVEAVSGNDGYAVISSGEVVINGGTFKAGVDENGEANAVVYARGNGKVYVNGGNFPNEANSTFVLNKRDADRRTTVIEVRGGSFRNFDPANNAAEGNGTNFCAEGLGTAVRDGYYVVVPQVVADLDNVTEATEVKFTEDLNVTSNTTIHTQKATAAITIDGNGKSVVSTAESADDFQWENGQFPAMSTIFSSVNGDKVTVSNLSFEGTMSALMLGHYVDSNSNWFNTELNNVNVVNTEVVSFSQNIAPAVCVYGEATLNNCNIYGTTLSELDTDPMWPVYDVAVVNEAVLTINNSNVGTIIAWAKSKVVVEAGSVVESIKPIYTSMNTNTKYGYVIKAGATVKVLDLSNINANKKINITIEDGATVGKVIGANGAEYPSLEAYKGSVSVNSEQTLKEALATEGAVVAVAAGSYTFPSSSVKAGQTIVCEEGTVFTGTSGLNINGATVVGATFSNPSGTAVSQTINGTFKNCTFEGKETLRWCYTTAGQTTVFENCVVKTTLRGFHFDGMDGNVIFRNCEINGFNAYGGEGTITFEDCTFGNDASNYNGLNIYSNTNIVNCTFNYVSGKTNFIDMEGTGKTLKITNCKATLNGVDANIEDYVGGSKLADNTVIIE